MKTRNVLFSAAVAVAGFSGVASASGDDQALIDAAIAAAGSERLCFDQDEQRTYLDADAARETSEVYTTPDGAKVVRLQCFLGAYQGSSDFVRIEGDVGNVYAVYPLKVETFEDSAVVTRSMLGGLSGYDPATGTVTTFAKGRGIGDCGTYFVHRIDNDADKLVLLEQRAKDECDGVYVEPAEYPIVYRR
jgi:hypothetical protein